MNDKDLKKLRRADLIEIIYQLQKNEKTLNREISLLRQRIEARRIAIENAGSIANASLTLNSVFETAQKAADEYLENIKLLNERSIQNEAESKVRAGLIIAEAEAEAKRLTANAEAETNGTDTENKADAGNDARGENVEDGKTPEYAAADAVIDTEEQTNEDITDVSEEAGEVIKRANEEAGEIIKRANEEAGEIIKKADAEASGILTKANAEAEAAINEANTYADNIMYEANARAQAMIAEADADVSENIPSNRNPKRKERKKLRCK